MFSEVKTKQTNKKKMCAHWEQENAGAKGTMATMTSLHAACKRSSRRSLHVSLWTVLIIYSHRPHTQTKTHKTGALGVCSVTDKRAVSSLGSMSLVEWYWSHVMLMGDVNPAEMNDKKQLSNHSCCLILMSEMERGWMNTK